MVRRDTLVERLVERVPESMPYLMARGIQCIACGAPVWGTLEEAGERQGYGDAEIEQIVVEIRELQKGDATP